MQTNVNNKKAKVEFPKLEEITLPKPKLFINPKEPVKVINGSYIIIDYCDFEAESNFIIYYNVFRDEFFGEAKIHRIPEITYEYDSSELKDLKIKLENKLENTLKQLRERI